MILELTTTFRVKSITFALISEPQPHLYYKTLEAKENEALGNALKNAREKLVATLGAAASANIKITNVEEPAAGMERRIPYERVGGRSGGATTGTPIELDVLWINRVLNVQFEF